MVRAIDDKTYCGFYRRRLLPVLKNINEYVAEARSSLVTLPRFGCVVFAVDFSRTVQQQSHPSFGSSSPNTKAVYYDPSKMKIIVDLK